MSTIRRPVGPQPASVYWRRRLVVLLGLVAVVVVIVLLVVGRPGAQTPTPTPNPTPSSSAGAVASAECDPAVVLVEPVTDATSYAAGLTPLLSMRITNRGAAACTLDVGTAAQVYLITSGSDQIWDSRHCQTSPESLEFQLEPNTPVTTEPFPWDRTRSSTSTCDGSRPEVIAGGATYRLSVQLGDVAGVGDSPFLLY